MWRASHDCRNFRRQNEPVSVPTYHTYKHVHQPRPNLVLSRHSQSLPSDVRSYDTAHTYKTHFFRYP